MTDASRAHVTRAAWRVLLIEDAVGDAELFRRAVQQCVPAAHVRVAPDLSVARLAIEETAVDVVFLDLRLPDGNGLSFLDWLKRDPVFRATPAVILTSSSSTTDREVATALGAERFFTKPADFDELTEIVASVASMSSDHAASSVDKIATCDISPLGEPE